MTLMADLAPEPKETAEEITQGATNVIAGRVVGTDLAEFVADLDIVAGQEIRLAEDLGRKARTLLGCVSRPKEPAR
jgi:hypothetical protein